jgi:hypothetical protein
VTKYGGITEYLDSKSAHIIKHKVDAVSGMEWSPLYDKTQKWAYPSTNHLTKLFRDVYENHTTYAGKAKRAKEIAGRMTIPKISEIIEKNIMEIENVKNR